MADGSDDKLLFRLQNIVPRGLASTCISNNEVAAQSAENIEIPMAWGNVGGKIFKIHFAFFFVMHFLRLKLKSGARKTDGPSSQFMDG